MKTVVLTLPSPLPLVTVVNADDSNFYGVRLGRSRERGFITRSKHGDGDFEIRCLQGFTRGNGWIDMKSPTLGGLLELIIRDDPNNVVFEFDTPSEFLRFLGGE